MFLRLQKVEQKTLVGKKSISTLENNSSTTLWQSFMPHVKDIQNRTSHVLVAMQVYDSTIPFEHFTPQTPFTIWAAAEVTVADDIPIGMEHYILNGGEYAVFLHIGEPWLFPKTWSYIMNEWLPTSGYELDSREHFAVMGAMYKHNQPDSQEEIFIPVKKKR